MANGSWTWTGGGPGGVWDNSPDALVDLCTSFCVSHLHSFCVHDSKLGTFTLRPGVTLPTEICERMLSARSNTSHGLDDAFVSLFRDRQSTRLRRVVVRNSGITDEGIAVILQHKPLELEVTNCPKVTEETLNAINRDGSSDLASLIVSNTTRLFPDTLFPDDDDVTSRPRTTPQNVYMSSSWSNEYLKRGYILKAPNLRRLVLNDLYVPVEQGYFSLLLKTLTRLTHLDLSGCSFLGSFSYICDLPHLVSLVLFDVPKLQDAFNAICQVKTLRHLDVSQHSDKNGTFANPNHTLAQIVENLQELVSLDISGTNLAGPAITESFSLKENGDINDARVLTQPVPDIPGLRSRANKPLDFLGLLYTSSEACHRRYIPAKRVTGEANEAQILAAAQAYVDRPEVLQKVLNDLFRIFRYETCRDTRLALEVILNGMGRHLGEKHIQISGSASLFYIIKGEEQNFINMKVKKFIIKTIMDAMWEHKYDTTMMRNGCLTLCQFRIPQDIFFDYERLVKLLLHIVSEEAQEEFVQRVGVYLLNGLACQVDGVQKELVGNLGAIRTMLSIIEKRLNRKLCDEVMEIAWSTMWNVTDETPVNCQRFLDGRGMEFFLGCLQAFPDKPELLRNMMGLLGNVAEVRELRSKLMTPEYVSVFSDLLDSRSDGIEVSYNAAGVISHMASDGDEAWHVQSPTREEVLTRMVSAIENWNLDAKRNINYRSFEPILRLLRIDHSPQAQHWAVWALANLTLVYPDKYCPLVEEEGGLQMLQEILKKNGIHLRIRQLARNVIVHCIWFQRYGNLNDLPNWDEVQV